MDVGEWIQPEPCCSLSAQTHRPRVRLRDSCLHLLTCHDQVSAMHINPAVDCLSWNWVSPPHEQSHQVPAGGNKQDRLSVYVKKTGDVFELNRKHGESKRHMMLGCGSTSSHHWGKTGVVELEGVMYNSRCNSSRQPSPALVSFPWLFLDEILWGRYKPTATPAQASCFTWLACMVNIFACEFPFGT